VTTAPAPDGANDGIAAAVLSPRPGRAPCGETGRTHDASTATSSRHHEGRGARCCPRGGARKPRARRRASIVTLSTAANELSSYRACVRPRACAQSKAARRPRRSVSARAASQIRKNRRRGGGQPRGESCSRRRQNLLLDVVGGPSVLGGSLGPSRLGVPMTTGATHPHAHTSHLFIVAMSRRSIPPSSASCSTLCTSGT